MYIILARLNSTTCFFNNYAYVLHITFCTRKCRLKVRKVFYQITSFDALVRLGAVAHASTYG